jgi:Tfp pilus assembly protein PilE
MKKIILVVSILLTGTATSFAQCDKKSVIHSSKTEYLDGNNLVERTVEENTVIEISKTDIIIKPGDKTMKAEIKSDTCYWTVPFKEGKTTFSVTFNDDQGNKKQATITIEGKGEKLILFVRTEGMPNIIRVPIDTFEEGK